MVPVDKPSWQFSLSTPPQNLIRLLWMLLDVFTLPAGSPPVYKLCMHDGNLADDELWHRPHLACRLPWRPSKMRWALRWKSSRAATRAARRLSWSTCRRKHHSVRVDQFVSSDAEIILSLSIWITTCSLLHRCIYFSTPTCVPVWSSVLSLRAVVTFGSPLSDSHRSAAGWTCSSLPAPWSWGTCPRPVGPPPPGLSLFVSSCSQSPADDRSASSAGTEEPIRTKIRHTDMVSESLDKILCSDLSTFCSSYILSTMIQVVLKFDKNVNLQNKII